MTISPAKANFNTLVLIFSNIYIRYPLSPIHEPLYRSTVGNLIFNIPISLSLLLRASVLPSIQLITLFSWAIVTIYKSTNALPMLVLSCELDVPGIVVIAACFGGILSVISYYNLSSEYIIKSYRKCYGGLLNGLGIQVERNN